MKSYLLDTNAASVLWDELDEHHIDALTSSRTLQDRMNLYMYLALRLLRLSMDTSHTRASTQTAGARQMRQ